MSKGWLIMCIVSGVVAISVSADDGRKRLEPDQVTIRNYEQYVAQVEYDLPVGTAFKDVEKYLSDNGIEYGYAPTEGCLKFMIKKIYSAFFIFITDLQIRIYISEEAGVTSIKSRLVNTAF